MPRQIIAALLTFHTTSKAVTLDMLDARFVIPTAMTAILHTLKVLLVINCVK